MLGFVDWSGSRFTHANDGEDDPFTSVIDLDIKIPVGVSVAIGTIMHQFSLCNTMLIFFCEGSTIAKQLSQALTESKGQTKQTK